MKRRSFIASVLAAGAAPYVAAGAVQRGVWMPVKARPIWVPSVRLYGADGELLSVAPLLSEAGRVAFYSGPVQATGKATRVIIETTYGDVLVKDVHANHGRAGLQIDQQYLVMGQQLNFHIGQT